MKILFIGDVFGSIGREMIEDYLHRIVKDNQIDFVIANVENTSHGKGLLKRHYDELSFQGIQAMTMGNHTFDKKELYDYIDEADKLIVPINQPKVLPGVKSRVFNVKDKASAVLGTHTHVQTADEKIIDSKLAFISDVGMTGPYMSAIGCDLDAIVTRLRGFGAPFIVAESSGQLSGVIITFEENTPVAIERILINQDHPY